MSISYTINQTADSATATVIFSDGAVKQIPSSHPRYADIVVALTAGGGANIDESVILDLVRPVLGAQKKLTRLSERVSYDGYNILFDGDAIDGALAEHIFRIIEEGGTEHAYKALVAFMEKLATNPSEDSRNSLYDFIQHWGITIDPDGDFYVYKGVNADGTSINSGFGIVDGVTMNGHLPNKPGSVIEIPRSMVDDNTSVACAVGLHAGSYDYASRFSQGKLYLVKVNPRDVVAVPKDHKFAKIRISRYKVVSETYAQTTVSTMTMAKTPAKTSAPAMESAIDEVVKRVKEDVAVTVNFDYTTVDGEPRTLTGFVATEVRYGDTVLAGIREDGLVRCYRIDRIKNLEIVEEEPNVTDMDKLITSLAGGKEVTVDFNYTTVDGEPRTLTGFRATELRKKGKLLVGVREDGKIRSYRVKNIDNLVIVPEPAAPVSPNELLAQLLSQGNTVLLDFVYRRRDGSELRMTDFTAKSLDDKGVVEGIRLSDGQTRRYRLDNMSAINILEENVTPEEDTSDETEMEKLLRTIKGQHRAAYVDFDYVKLNGENRLLRNFLASETYNGMIVGYREGESESRRYLIDRISNLTLLD